MVRANDTARIAIDLDGLAPIAQALGHRVGRSTIARTLKAHGIPPVPERPTSWRTFLRAHWGAIAGADFFTTEVWTWRGLVTYYTGSMAGFVAVHVSAGC
jgi:hypothetical protein